MKMQRMRWLALCGLVACGMAALLYAAGPKPDTSDVKDVLTGTAAFDTFETERPGTFRKITVPDLPKPYATEGVGNPPHIVPRPANAWPQAPDGFKVQLYAENLVEPREIKTAPNGDLFVAESHGNKIDVFRGITADGKPQQTSTFATGLHQPFGIAFYPLGGNPQWVYIANTNSVVRFPYKNGDLTASAAPETIIAELPAGGGHWTRDLAFSPDGSKLFVSVGSASNVDDPDTHPREHHRANILEYTPDGKFVKVYASGIRNPVGIAVNPSTGQLWCSVNERDMLGDNLVPDYITSVKEDGFYGWPWYYMGDHQDPRLEGTHPELKGKVTVPDVLLQPHNASLELTFYEGSQFPSQFHGDIFAAEHGSWNKSIRAGYEVIRVPLDNGKATGVYEDFLTGFVVSNDAVWGRPVGVAVAHDGSLMVTDDGSKSIWRVTYTGKSDARP
jgi:glucose/arabinose dehydrogenase